MTKKLFAVTLALVVSVIWIKPGSAQPSAPNPILRITTSIVLPDKRDQVATVMNVIHKLYTTTKGIQWSKIGYDAYTGELVILTLWNSQGDMAEFTKSDAYTAFIEKLKPFMQGDPSIKTYSVYEAQK
jgi:quinol monooxygenase YgiN